MTHPEFFDSDEMRAALAARNIGTTDRLLGRLGVSELPVPANEALPSRLACPLGTPCTTLEAQPGADTQELA